MMTALKINLEPGTKYVGPTERGAVQQAMAKLVENIILGTLEIEGREVTNETITFRVDTHTLGRLKELASEKNMTVTHLVREAMIKSNFIAKK
jgi:hypothetical protein